MPQFNCEATPEEMAISGDKNPQIFKSKGLSSLYMSLFSLNMKDEDQFFPEFEHIPDFK